MRSKNILYNLKLTLMGVAVVSIIAGIVYIGFIANRYSNWKFGYESMVKSKIEETVKPECLR